LLQFVNFSFESNTLYDLLGKFFNHRQGIQSFVDRQLKV